MTDVQQLGKLIAQHPALQSKPGGEGRSPHWSKVRGDFLQGKCCAACGGGEDLEAHHVEPFHLCPAKELDPRNLCALCEHPGRDCHFRFGHNYDWKKFNPNVRKDAAAELRRLKSAESAWSHSGKLLAALAALALLITPTRGGSADPSFINSRSHDTEELTVDLPGVEQIKNIGSKIDNAGMCVFTSVEMAADWAGMTQWKGFRDWCAAKYPGGGDPQKLPKLIQAYAQTKGLAPPRFIQYQGPDPEPILELIDRTGRMACVTYGYGPRYGAGGIGHMVNMVKFSGRYGTVLDNNYPGVDAYEWMDKAELVKRIKTSADWRGRRVPGSAWIFVWLAPPPPPIPRN